MKPQGRIQSIIDILDKSHISRVPLDSVVGDYMRHRRYIGSKDRAFIAEGIYEIARAHARLGWWLEQRKVQDTPRTRVLAYLSLIKNHNEKYIAGLFDGSKYAPEPMDSHEEHLIQSLAKEKELAHPDMPIDIRVECPPLYADNLKTYFGNDFETEMTAMIEGATLDMRVNTFLCDVEKAKNYLEADGIPTTHTPYSKIGLRAKGKAYLARTKAFNKGWIEIQDEGSQLIAAMCDAKPGMQVLDYCAGAGGKTLALGAAMQRKGRIVAMDMDERRLKKGKERYKKAHLADIIETRVLSDEKQRKWVKRQKEKFDIVLLDVPCTGTGTWRRNPDMRWRTYGPSLEELIEIQKDILNRACNAVKPGGKLVYATCSLLAEENENQVETFLREHEEFELLPIKNIWKNSQTNSLSGEAQGTPHSETYARDAATKPEEELGRLYMRLTPHRHNTDGFFTCVMVKKEHDS